MSISNGFTLPQNNKMATKRESLSEGPRLEEDQTTKTKVLGCLKKNMLVIFLIIGMIIGFAIGFIIRDVDPDFTNDKRRKMYLRFCGELFLNMLKMIIIPLVFTSLIAGMANLPSQAAGRVGGRAVAYYMLTTFLAVLLGILLVTTIKPGDKGDKIEERERNKELETSDAILNLVRNMFPRNLIEAAIKQADTTYTRTDIIGNITDEMTGITLVDQVVGEKVDFNNRLKDGTNVLGIILFSIVLGIIIGRMGPQGKILHIFFSRMQDAIIAMVHLIIWFSPIGVMCLLAEKIVDMEDPATSFKQLAYYMLTVLLGLAIHFFIFLPLIHFLFTRKNPARLFLDMLEALLTAWGTASSSATLPVTLKCIEENAKVNPIISRFVLPVGATINMDGTALYEAVAAIFIAQYNDISLDAGQVITVAITATLAAIGAAGVPEGGLVTMVIVLSSVGLPTRDIGLILAVDWFLDRFRTATNVWGDSIGARVVEALSKKDLEKISYEQEEQAPSPMQNVFVVDKL